MKTLLMMALIATVPVTPTPVTATPVTVAVASLEAAIEEQADAAIQPETEAAPLTLGPAQTADVTFYHAQSPWGSRTASGVTAYEGCIAADASLPFGTILYIPELSFVKEDGLFVVQDRGSAIKGNLIDVYLSDTAGYASVSQRARAYGRTRVVMYPVLQP
jgi:3D (Asp-Asp-Asp) domain-containing protein